MASGPITSWQIDGGKVETVTDFIFLGSKTTVDVDCSLCFIQPSISHVVLCIYFGYLMRRVDSLEKTLMLGGTGGRRRRGRQDEMAGWNHRLDGHEFG